MAITYIEADGAVDGIIAKSGRPISKPRPESVWLVLAATWREAQNGISTNAKVVKSGDVNLSLPYRNKENALRQLAAGIPQSADISIEISEGGNKGHAWREGGSWLCQVGHTDGAESTGAWDRTKTKRKSKKGGDGINLPSDIATTVRKTLDLMFPQVRGRSDSKAEIRGQLLEKLGTALAELESAIASSDMALAAEVMEVVRQAKAELANV